MSREMIKGLVDMVPEKDIDAVYNAIVKFIPNVEPEQDEIEAIAEARSDTSPTVSHNSINWD